MTNAPLKQIPLSVRMADRMQADIAAGVWREILPGCRALAGRYGTSVKTALAALEILEQRGWIEPASQGSRRRVRKDAAAKTKVGDDSPGVLLMLYASDIPIAVDFWNAFVAYRECWTRNGGSAVVTQVNFGRYKKPTSILRALIEQHHASALVMDGAPVAWVEAATAQLPVYLAGGEWHTVEGSGDAFSFFRETVRAITGLHGLGHRRFLIPSEAHLPLVREKTMDALHKVLGAEIRGELVERMCPVFTESVPDVWMDYWAKAFSQVNPTAVIVFKEPHLLSLYGYCAGRGIHIPGDLSVIYVGYNAHLEWCRPAPCQMRFPLHKSAAHFRRWLRNGLRPIGTVNFPLEMIPGASVAKPRAQASAPAK